MTKSNNFDKFNAKTFNRFNKNLENADKIKQMLVNYKWSVKHLRELDESYAKVAIEQFNKMVEQFNVKLEEDKKEAKANK